MTELEQRMTQLERKHVKLKLKNVTKRLHEVVEPVVEQLENRVEHLEQRVGPSKSGMTMYELERAVIELQKVLQQVDIRLDALEQKRRPASTSGRQHRAAKRPRGVSGGARRVYVNNARNRRLGRVNDPY